MSVTTPPVISTGTNGQAIGGTSGTSLANPSATALNSNEFLQLMMVQLQNQDPTNPSTQDPTQFLTQLAQLTQVEQETNTAQSTSQTASEQAVASAVALIGDTVNYTDPSTGAKLSGSVQSVQITSAGPTLTVNGIAGVTPASVTAVTAPATSTGTSTSTSSGTTGTTGGSTTA
ncbi:flagellar hook capping FlgD N-terminal domain-containing protein [Conexibacter sp. DBS9H8]|uniref:flagellar hook capping FlgD N-terminal domain-containing protein n=1 Tax=Conexibacter sp. DBS9H8 TaxID=2937801 RepID=UPI002010A4FF|nr:flagellar hook capping FlgD N-terminal domain-containing protein [Conexibacter sp. DBS9H8]